MLKIGRVVQEALATWIMVCGLRNRSFHVLEGGLAECGYRQGHFGDHAPSRVKEMPPPFTLNTFTP